MSSVALDSDQIDLSGVVTSSSAVVASPAAAAETIIASITLPVPIRADQKIVLLGWCAYTAGTNGVLGTVRIRRTDASGTVKNSSGALTVVATKLYNECVLAVDTGVVSKQVYVLTLEVGSGSAESTVSAVTLAAIAL